MRFRIPRAVESAARVVRGIVRETQIKNVPFMAGSIAYSAFVSLLPLVLFLVLAASLLGGEPLADHVQRVTESYLTPAGQSLLADSVSGAGNQAGLSLLGLGVLLWGVLRVFRALDTAFSTIYDTQRRNGLPNQLRDGLVVLAALAAALLTLVVAGVAFRYLPALPFPRLVGKALLVVGLAVVFVPIYYVFPDVDLTVGMILPGAVVAAVGWMLLDAGFGVYAAHSSTQDLYGVVGGVILLITFLYFGALVILVGAVTNVVLMGRRPRAVVETTRPR